MKWIVRCAFMTVLALGLGDRVLAPASATIPAPAASLSAVLGPLIVAPIALRPGGQTGVLVASIRTCSAPLLAAPVDPSFTTAAMLEPVRRPGDHAYYVYLDWASDHPDRWGLLQRRIQEKVAEALRVSPYDGDAHMLFVSEPAGCSAARGLPWRRYWLRQRGG